MAFFESRMRSIFKAVSWRLVGSGATAVATYLMVGRWDIAVVVGGVEATTKFVLFFFHERLWNKLPFGRKTLTPKVIWLTGLSGAGKTTIARILGQRLRAMGARVEELDGDTIRDIFPQTGFSREERDQHVKRVGYLASRLEKQGVFVVASLISPYRDSREFVRGLCDQFVEVHVATSLEECQKRDPKGLYKKASQGELRCFTGIDDPYESPLSPEIKIDTQSRSPESCATEIMQQALRPLREESRASSQDAWAELK